VEQELLTIPVLVGFVLLNLKCEVYSIQHFVMKFVSDLRKVGGFHRVLRFPLPIKLTATI